MQRVNNSNGQQCIQVDFSASLGSFHALITDVSTSQIKDRENSITTYKNLLNYAPLVNASSYKPDDLVGLVVYVSDSFGLCSQSQIRFLINVNSVTCSRIGYLADNCNSYLSTEFYKSFANVNSVINLDYSTKAESSGNVNSTTSYQSSTCFNAVIQVDYVIYTNADQNNIESVFVSFVLANITSSNYLNIAQVFSVTFYTSTNAKSTSGNPGYLTGKPLLAYINGNSTSFQLQGSSVTGACSNTLINGTVLSFGINTIYSCYNSFTYSSLKAYCASSLDVTTTSLFSYHSQLTKIGK